MLPTTNSRNSYHAPSSRSVPTTPIVQHAASSSTFATPGKHTAQWPIYACCWSKDRIGIASHLEDSNNRIALLNVERHEDLSIRKYTDALVGYPVTKMAFEPNGTMLATTSDRLRLYTTYPEISLHSTLNNSKSEFYAPLTSFDWNTVSPNLLITSSIDTTCTIWDLNTKQAKMQLIAHDKEVFDVKFSAGSDVCFCSVGADGSVRVFDTRSLEHSTIVYETAKPLLRIAANARDQNLFATFGLDSSVITILDIRSPGSALLELCAHSANANAIDWMPNSRNVLASIADDAQLFLWDLASQNGEKCPIMMWRGEGEGNNLCWDERGDWLAVAVGRTIQPVKS